MKLISCHIDRFGAISDKDYTFDGGLNGIKADNGAGKSTLSAFLSAMLFGLPRVRSNAKDFNDREHYYPFAGGSFGGSLVFKTDAGDEYLIRREFDRKSETQDALTVTKNGEPFECRGREIGEILFGVDADAFARTAFLSAETLDPDPGKSLSDRLCETVANPEGTVPAEKAIAALDAAAKKIIQGRGKNGLYDQALAEEGKTETALREAKEAAKTLPALREEYEKTARDLTALNARKLWASYDDLLARVKEAETKRAEADARFKNGVPDEAALTGAEEKIRARDRAAHDAETGFTPSARQTELAARFGGKRPDEAVLAKMDGKAKEIREARQTALPSATAPSSAPAKPKTAGWVLPVAAGGGFAFLAGLILLILSYTLPGVILLALGVVGLGAGLYFLFQGKVNALASSISAVDPGGVERARRAQLDADLSALLAPYGYSSPDGALAALADLKRDLADLDAAEKEKADAGDRQAKAKERLAALDAELTAFFAQYAIPAAGDFRAAMNELRGAIRDVKSSALKVEEAKRAAADFAAKQGLTERPTDAVTDADPETLAALEKAKTDLAVRIRTVETVANGVPALEDALERAREKVAEWKSRHARLTAARDLLQTAQTNLVRRYVDPVKQAFVAYADALSSFLGEKVALSPRFELTYESDGAYRDVRHLSRGESSVAALCLRMALSDSLYEGREQPPLILDDPLVHLDENNLEKAKTLLRDLAKKRQIVCLTCHGSRAV